MATTLISAPMSTASSSLIHCEGKFETISQDVYHTVESSGLATTSIYMQNEAYTGQTLCTTVELAEMFSMLSEWWHEATDFLSSPSEKAAHSAYQRIIALGSPVVPLVLRDLEATGNSGWYAALRKLTGTSPVPPEAASSSARVRQAWLEWGRRRGLI